MDEQSSFRKTSKQSVAARGREAKKRSDNYTAPPPAEEVTFYQRPDTSEYERKTNLYEQIALQEQKNDRIFGLPYMYGWKWYPWAREFFESRNKLNFLCAANQISKSSTQIRKAIHWATARDMWPQLWQRPPSQFWYLYPSQEVINIEFELKWEKEFLPRGKYKDDPVFGWDIIKKRGDIKGIHFKSGVYLFFKAYAQDVQHLQTGTCDAIFCDEELPEELYSELAMRLNATDGYFHMVFTATLGQEIWRLTMEPGETEEEQFPTAFKQTISLYDSKYYEDGTPSHWTEDRINGVVAKCKSQQEVLKRVFGRFIVLTGLKYPTFDVTRHVRKGGQILPNYDIYNGADPGTGGKNNHPAALCYLAVAPDRRSARVVMGWRGDGIDTTNDDVVKEHIKIKKDWGFDTSGRQYYDHSNKDFELTAMRMEEPFLKADKRHEIGEGILNTLFKNGMLFLDAEVEELAKLSTELSTLREGQNKRHARDDFIDALRYAVSRVPWDFSGIVGAPSDWVEPVVENLTPQQIEVRARRAQFLEENEEDSTQAIEDEFTEWNEAYG